MSIWKWLYCWLGGGLLYWGFISKIQVQQLAAAAVVSVGVSVALRAVASETQLSFVVKWTWIVKLLRVLPGKVLRNSGLLLRALWHSFTTGERPAGAFHALPFDRGQADSASTARRALVFAAISLPPNSFAVSCRGEDELFVHQLVREPASQDRQWPI